MSLLLTVPLRLLSHQACLLRYTAVSRTCTVDPATGNALLSVTLNGAQWSDKVVRYLHNDIVTFATMVSSQHGLVVVVVCSKLTCSLTRSFTYCVLQGGVPCGSTIVISGHQQGPRIYSCATDGAHNRYSIPCLCCPDNSPPIPFRYPPPPPYPVWRQPPSPPPPPVGVPFQVVVEPPPGSVLSCDVIKAALIQVRPPWLGQTMVACFGCAAFWFGQFAAKLSNDVRGSEACPQIPSTGVPAVC